MITPEILPRNSPGVTTELPRTPEPFLPAMPDKKTNPVPPPAFEGTRRMGEINQVARPVAAPAPLPSTRPGRRSGDDVGLESDSASRDERRGRRGAGRPLEADSCRVQPQATAARCQAGRNRSGEARGDGRRRRVR